MPEVPPDEGVGVPPTPILVWCSRRRSEGFIFRPSTSPVACDYPCSHGERPTGGSVPVHVGPGLQRAQRPELLLGSPAMAHACTHPPSPPGYPVRSRPRLTLRQIQVGAPICRDLQG